MTTCANRPSVARQQEVLALKGTIASDVRGFLSVLTCPSWGLGHLQVVDGIDHKSKVIDLPETLDYLEDGDILRFDPTTGHISVLYRKVSGSNTILLTEECNNYCLMCSQPPVNRPPHSTFDTWKQAIPLILKDTKEIGISGGEPTLYSENLLELVRLCRNYLPRTSLHILSNGRYFSYLTYCEELAKICHHDLMIGIPLYSDLNYHHDFIVQAHGAFDQTVRGILNLARSGVTVELRVVLLKQNIERLVALAQFIGRNFPFANHIALMGLEPIGFAKANLAGIWIDPFDYKTALKEATLLLAQSGMNVSIYNHQLCVLDEAIWPFARRSISDWKQEYFDQCSGCSVRKECCGFFSSAITCHSKEIRAIPNREESPSLPV